MVFYAFLGFNKYMEDNQIPHHYLLIQKQNQEYYLLLKNIMKNIIHLLLSV